jgi:hypothetical protein
MTPGAILAFLISNGPSIIGAGIQVSAIVSEFFSRFGGKGKDEAVTPAEFDAFVSKFLGNREEILALVEKAKQELAGA